MCADQIGVLFMVLQDNVLLRHRKLGLKYKSLLQPLTVALC